MRKAFILLVVACLLPGALWGQTPVLDSLRRNLENHARADTARVNRLNQLALELRNLAADESASCFGEALRISQQLAYTAGLAEAQLGLGFYHRHRGEYDLAERYSEQARQDFATVNDRTGQTRCLYNLASGYSERGMYVQSLAANLKGLALAEAQRDYRWMAFLNTRLGITSTLLGEYGRAQEYLTQGLKWAEKSGNELSIGNAHSGIGDLYRRQGKWAMAQKSYEKEAVISKRVSNPGELLFANINIGEMAERQEHYAEAMAYGRLTVARARELQLLGQLPRAQLLLARAFLRTGRADSALAYGRQSLRNSQRSGLKSVSRDASEVLAQASFTLGRPADAYRYEQLFGTYRDSLNSSDLQRRGAVLEYRAALAKKEAEIGLLTKNSELIRRQNRAQRWFLLGALLSLGAVASLSLVLWRSNGEKRRAYALLKQQQDELRAAQDQLVQAEKWAFVGELSAGIAHELQNPLNFMKNFAEVSVAMLNTEAAGGAVSRRGAAELEKEIMAGLKQNLQQISQHGQRASSIISDMLAHARTGTGPRAPTDLNALAEESLTLAYRALQAEDKTFQAKLDRDLDPNLTIREVVPQDLGRVLLNLCTNALYAVRQRQQQATAEGASYVPAVVISTCQHFDRSVEIRVRDNGTGMSEAVRARAFEPFFTTKPAGEGTGLGLSLSHDIVSKGHGGTLTLESWPGEGTEFVLTLPA